MSEPLECSLEATPEGDRVRFRLTVRNAGEAPIEVTYRDSGKADVAVYDADGGEGEGGEPSDRERWRWSDGRAFMQVLQQDTLGPDETRTFEREWPDPPAGEYEAEGVLRATDADAGARTRFSI